VLGTLHTTSAAKTSAERSRALTIQMDREGAKGFSVTVDQLLAMRKPIGLSQSDSPGHILNGPFF
jgi:hypothetical protein